MKNLDFISGNNFKNNCHYSHDEYGFNKILEPKENEIVKIFIKIDFVHIFFRNKINRPYILFTHNGDLPINDTYINYLYDENLIIWYGQNINTIHPKLKSIPIGIANEMWPHGDKNVLNEIINEDNKKDKLIYVNFDVNTNLFERNHCLNEINKHGLKMENKLPFKDYLRELSKSYFVISPNGNGIDCHKTWEALYLKTIPIVTKSINIDFYKNYPIFVIDDWSEFNLSYFTIEEYYKIWNNFDTNKLIIKNFI